MSITIHTSSGTFIVPADKQPALIHWLQQNAVKAGQEPIREQSQHSSQPYTGRQLINENH